MLAWQSHHCYRLQLSTDNGTNSLQHHDMQNLPKYLSRPAQVIFVMLFSAYLSVQLIVPGTGLAQTAVQRHQDPLGHAMKPTAKKAKACAIETTSSGCRQGICFRPCFIQSNLWGAAEQLRGILRVDAIDTKSYSCILRSLPRSISKATLLRPFRAALLRVKRKGAENGQDSQARNLVAM